MVLSGLRWSVLIKDAVFNIVDIETTGLDSKRDKVVSIASVRCSLKHGILSQYSTLVNPGCPIPAEASAIHHITNKHVDNKGPLEWAIPSVFPDEMSCVVAHNAAFDKPFVDAHKETDPWLCTLRISRHLWPAVPRHSNQFLRYHLQLDVPEAEGMPAHDALSDALVTAKLLLYELDIVMSRSKAPDSATTGDLIKWAESPVLLSTCRFGAKHYGKPWAEVPTDYLEWMRKNVNDMDIDTRFTVEHYLGGKGRR